MGQFTKINGHYFADFEKCKACGMTYEGFRDNGEPLCLGPKQQRPLKEGQPIPDDD